MLLTPRRGLPEKVEVKGEVIYLTYYPHISTLYQKVMQAPFDQAPAAPVTISPEGHPASSDTRQEFTTEVAAGLPKAVYPWVVTMRDWPPWMRSWE